MKIIIIKYATSFIVLILFISSKTLPSDYRDSYVGNYFCKKDCQVVNSNRSGLEIVSDTVTVHVTKDVADSTLNLAFGQLNVKVKLKGMMLLAYPFGGHFSGRFFMGDSIKFGFSIGKVSNVCSLVGKK
jgi:hypothetical protein